MPAEVAIDVIIQDAPTDWISPPKFDTVLASHTLRNTGTRKGAAADTAFESIFSVGATRAMAPQEDEQTASLMVHVASWCHPVNKGREKAQESMGKKC